MTNSIKDLFYDKEVVGKIKEVKVSKEMLYNHLFNGRITLQEYLSAERNLG